MSMTLDEISEFLQSLGRTSGVDSPDIRQRIVSLFEAVGQEHGRAAAKAYRDAFNKEMLEALTEFQSDFAEALRDLKEGE